MRGRATATPSRTAGRCSTGSVSRRTRSGSRISWRRCCTSPEGCRCRSRASTTARPACPRSGRPASSRAGRSTRPSSPTTRRSSATRSTAAGWATPVRTTGSPIADVACSSSRGRTATRRPPIRCARQHPEAPDLVVSPDEVFGPKWCLAIAAAEWADRGCNGHADADDIRRVTRAINGGLIGLSDRIDWLHRTKAVWLDDA